MGSWVLVLVFGINTCVHKLICTVLSTATRMSFSIILFFWGRGQGGCYIFVSAPFRVSTPSPFGKGKGGSGGVGDRDGVDGWMDGWREKGHGVPIRAMLASFR